MTNKFILFAGLMVLTACSSNQYPMPTPPTPTPMPRAAYQDISRMDLQSGLNTKYLSVQLNCGADITSQDTQADGSVATVIDHQAQVLVWDLLQKYSVTSTQTISNTEGRVRYTGTLNLQVGLDTENNYIAPGTPTQVYNFTNAVKVTILQKNLLFSWYNAAGNLVVISADNDSTGDEVLRENVPFVVSNLNSADGTTHIVLTCTLTAPIRPGYESDTKVSSPK